MNAPRVSLERVGKDYAGHDGVPVPVLKGIDMTASDHEFVAIVGASGCGKSTLLRLVAGLDDVTSGTIRVAGRPVAGPGPDRGMVFQQSTLFPWLTVWQNLRFSRGLAVNAEATSLEVSQYLARSEALLNMMGLARVRESYPNQLSGGMQQRVNIARALVANPEVLLMDEPFGALDAQTRETMHDLVLHLFAAEKTTALFVTHDVEEAIYLADRVVVLAPNPGRVDSTHVVPWGRARAQELKLESAFVTLKGEILARIRATSAVHADHELLASMAVGARAQSVREGGTNP
ncbi:ABC transporter ATP-binding protein [Acidiferrobacter sp.]|uniref:ABC transporter ATP-binding protein n=1 Tax=Acidiferrobacter sp. TaxID=1872107 RepID=UPI0026397BDF|nr:ABC transporter ATP-binding protein [Acidiferrobacter sp.]